MEHLAELGYLGLFLSAFLAATILPLSSEVVLSLLLLNQFNPYPLIAVATLGNLLGSLTNYLLGYWGSTLLAGRVLKMSESTLERAEQRFRAYGLAALLFAWVPIIGDPLTVVAGALRVRLLWFVLLVGAGKLARYIAVSYIILP